MVRIHPSVFLLLALGVLLIPLNWLGGAVFSVAVHEACHLTAIYILGGKAETISIGHRGIEMAVMPMSPGRELICALAGPAGSFLLLAMQRWFPAAAVCGLMQGFFNLLPMYPLDGGRALKCLLCLIGLEGSSGKILKTAEWVVSILIIILGCYGAMKLGLGISPVIFSMAVLLRSIGRKNSLQRRERASTIGLPYTMR